MSDHPPSSRRVRGTLEFYSTIPRARVNQKYLLNCVRHAAKRLRHGYHSLSFILITDRKMAKLHRDYSGIPGTTDVLTFDLTEKKAHPVEGEIYICLDQARRQAAEWKIPLYREVARLAAHGTLHLAGYRDKTESEREGMRRLENLALQAG
ncbi:rRNA maturation RNase YbeY, partial [bacterium]|nr:rRNA maturation RNase YbeY [bacterium]